MGNQLRVDRCDVLIVACVAEVMSCCVFILARVYKVKCFHAQVWCIAVVQLRGDKGMND